MTKSSCFHDTTAGFYCSMRAGRVRGGWWTGGGSVAGAALKETDLNPVCWGIDWRCLVDPLRVLSHLVLTSHLCVLLTISLNSV